MKNGFIIEVKLGFRGLFFHFFSKTKLYEQRSLFKILIYTSYCRLKRIPGVEEMIRL